MESRLYITITTVFTSFILSSVFGRLYRKGTVIPKVSVQGVKSLLGDCRFIPVMGTLDNNVSHSIFIVLLRLYG